jgi:predicted O-methyltransferase YrrM
VSALPPTLLEDYIARLGEPSHREGGGNDIKDEMPYLLTRAHRYTRPDILEIGVRTGRSTSAFLAGIAEGGGGHLYSIDAADPQVPASWAASGYWSFTRARSEDVTPELAGWPSGFDIVFIDGDHQVAAVLGDLRRFVPYVKPGGVVLCHDTRLPCATGEAPEVARALDLFCAEYHLAARELPWQPGVTVRPGRVTWTEKGGQFGLGVIESPNG